MRALKEWLVDAFRQNGPFRASVLVTYVVINGIVFSNSLRQDYHIGYDAAAHLDYVRTLATGRLPTAADSTEFFSAPLAYVPGAVLNAMGVGEDKAFRGALIANFIYSLLLTFFLLKLCGLAHSGRWLKLCVLGCLGMIGAYYRTFAMIRGEPLLGMLAVVAAYLSLRLPWRNAGAVWRAVALGSVLGLMVLARQWGFFLLPPLILPGLVAMAAGGTGSKRASAAGNVAVAGLVCALVGGGFYVHLYRSFGTVRAFNRPAVGHFSLANQPRSFYTDIPIERMLHRPVMHELAGRSLPILFSDFWGDYWKTFLVYAKTDRGRWVAGAGDVHQWRDRPLVENNDAKMAPYLGRVNAVSIFPSVLLIAGLVTGMTALFRAIAGRRSEPPDLVLPVCAACVVCTLAGYFWFIVCYSDATGDTLKASYLLQTFPFLGLMAGAWVDQVLRRLPRTGAVMALLLLACAAHNAPTFFTRFVGPAPLAREGRHHGHS